MWFLKMKILNLPERGERGGAGGFAQTNWILMKDNKKILGSKIIDPAGAWLSVK